jgi:hypothetical protein
MYRLACVSMGQLGTEVCHLAVGSPCTPAGVVPALPRAQRRGRGGAIRRAGRSGYLHELLPAVELVILDRVVGAVVADRRVIADLENDFQR